MRPSILIATVLAGTTAAICTHADEQIPRLDLPTIEDRSAWSAFPQDAREIWVELARREMERKVPVFSDELFLEYSRTGSRSAYDHRHSTAISRYSAMVLGELIQNEGAFLPEIVAATEGLLAERTWVLSAHDRSLDAFYGRAPVVDLASSHRAMILALVSVMLEPILPADLVKRMRNEVKTRVTDVYRAAVVSGEVPPGLWWMKTTNNWNSVCHNGVVTAALAIEEDPAKRFEILEGMDRYLPIYLDGFTDDGYCTEGMGYWNYGFGNFVMLSEFIRRATGGETDWLNSEKVVSVAFYPFRLELVDDTYPTFADGTVGARPNPVLLDFLAKRMEAIEAIHGTTSGLGAYGFTEVVSFGLAGQPAPITTKVENLDQRRDGFPDAGLLILRPGDSSSRISLAVKAGHNAEHHNHNDVGTFVVAVDKTLLILDPGGEIYTARTFSSERYVSNVLNSFGHPVPRVGGNLQSTGKSYRGTIISTEFTPDHDRAVIDLATAYEMDGLLELIREINYSRQNEGSVRVTDAVRLESPDTFETALITYGRWEQKAPDRALLYQGDAALDISWESSPVTFEVSTLTIEENVHHGSQPLRIAFTTEEPVTEASITIEMKPAESPVSFEVDMDGHAPQLERAVRVQAESFNAQTEGEVMIAKKVNSDGMAFKNWDALGHALTWELQVPSEGDYALRLRYCHAVPGLSLRTIAWKGMADTRSASFPSTGGWSTYRDDWSTAYAGLDGKPYFVHLEEGLQELTLTNQNGHALNLDWIELVPVLNPGN